jgi:hypothetical protein
MGNLYGIAIFPFYPARQFWSSLRGLRLEHTQAKNVFVDKSIKDLSEGIYPAKSLHALLNPAPVWRGCSLRRYYMFYTFIHTSDPHKSLWIEYVSKYNKRLLCHVILVTGARLFEANRNRYRVETITVRAYIKFNECSRPDTYSRFNLNPSLLIASPSNESVNPTNNAKKKKKNWFRNDKY